MTESSAEWRFCDTLQKSSDSSELTTIVLEQNIETGGYRVRPLGEALPDENVV